MSSNGIDRLTTYRTLTMQWDWLTPTDHSLYAMRLFTALIFLKVKIVNSEYTYELVKRQE